MKRLVLAIAVATMAYSAWWFYAANDMRRSVESWFEAQRAAGWNASYSDIAVRGFPNRTDLTLTDPKLQSPDGSFGWQAPFFQVLALSYNRSHVIVAWPDTQTVQTADTTIAMTSDGLRASVVFDQNNIQRSNIEAITLNLADQDQTIAMAGLNAALEMTNPTGHDYRVALSLEGLALSDPTITGTNVPDAFATLRADTTVSLSSLLTVDTLNTAPPQINGLEVRTTQVNYGALTMHLAGTAKFDAQGRATGDITVEAQNWRDALNSAQDTGSLPPGVSDVIIDVLTMVATLNGARDTLDVTLGLDRGTVLLGPLPIGKLPALSWP